MLSRTIITLCLFLIGPAFTAAPASAEAPDWPNEPEGFIVLTDQPWNVLPSDPGNPWNVTSENNLAIEPDPTAPQSPPNVMRVRAREGIDGVGTHNTWYRFPEHLRNARELYLAVWYKFPSDWVNHGVGTKSFWPLPHNHNNSPYTAFDSVHMRIFVNFQGEPWGNRNLRPNAGPAEYRDLRAWRDQWVLLEYYFKMNTVNDQEGNESRADGVVRAWLTAGGQTHMVMDHQDVKWFNVNDPGELIGRNGRPVSGFMSIRWNPTYGGVGRPAPREMFNYVDHIYVSAPPQE